jgi:hypothetical protein
MNNDRYELIRIAALFAEEIREGKWDKEYKKHLPITMNKRLIEELEKRCPGFDEKTYKDAIAEGMQNTK